MFLCLVCYTGFQSVATILATGVVANLIDQLGIVAHYNSMSRGVIDSRDVIYFISLTALFLVFTRLKLESRKW